MKKILICIIVFFFCNCVGLTQPIFSTTSRKAIALYLEADNFRVRGDYDRAIDLLLLALDKDKNFEEAYYRLALTYKYKEDILKSTQSFESGLLLVDDPKRRRDYLYELTQNYLKLGKYLESQKKAVLFLKEERLSNVRIDQVSMWKLQAEYGLNHANEKLSYEYSVLNDSINRYANQYFPVLTADTTELFFTVRQGSGINDNEDIVVSKKDLFGRWQSPVSISPRINSKLQEGACSVSADGRQLIFTICGGVTYGRCDLFESKKIGNEWSKPTNLGPLVNSSDWEGQPSLSADGRILYFSSMRKGGVGGYDIWFSKKDDSGKWTKAQNLGATINSKFDEISPFIHVNNQTLYFSSNGYAGFGGYDIYQSEKGKNGWSPPLNLGAPLNDYEDQFSFFVTANGTEAYFSKADVTNHGYSKLYQTTIPLDKQPIRKSFSVKGIVRDNETGKPIKANLELSDQRLNEKIEILESDSLNGNYLFVLTRGAKYSLFVTADGYLFRTYTFEVDSTQVSRTVLLDIELKPIRQRASSVLNNIFFDYDKYEIKPESYSELANVLKFLKKYPALFVEIGGHTDSKGTDDYNFKLSQKRAQAVADYFLSNGIEKSKITIKGFGASKPLVENNSEANRQVNRRIEFVIVK